MNESAIAICYPKSSASKELYIGILLILTMALLPVYYFQSGKPQFVDVIIIITIFSMIIRGDKQNKYFAQQILYLLPFVLWAMIINLIYFASNYNDITLLKKIIEIIYLMIVTYTFMIVFVNLLTQENIKYLYFGLLFSVFMCFTVNGASDEKGSRIILSFNNANQLGYFGVIMMSFVVTLSNINKIDLKTNKLLRITNFILIIAAHIFVLLSISRCSMGGIFLIDLYYLKYYSWKRLAVFGFVIFGLLTTIVIIYPKAIDKIAKIESRINEIDIQSRLNKQYNRLVFLYDWQIIVGTGGGKSEVEVDGREIHNIWANIFRTYGLIGLLLICFWFGRFIWLVRNLDGGWLICAGLSCYNSFQYGLRFRSFWVLFSLMIALSYLVSLKNQKTSQLVKMQSNNGYLPKESMP
jgi:hypothetical protein